MKDYTLNKQFPLTDEQNEIVDFMLSRNYCVNAAQTGYGKTYMSLTRGCSIYVTTSRY